MQHLVNHDGYISGVRERAFNAQSIITVISEQAKKAVFERPVNHDGYIRVKTDN